MLSRRSFFKVSGTTLVAVLAMRNKVLRVLAAPIPGGTLDPLAVPKYQTPLLIPPVMPKAGTVKLKGGKNADLYEISVRQFEEQILPAGLPATTVWGYGSVRSASPRGLLLHHAPSLTIEASVDKPVCVKWINELVDGSGNYLPHLLPVDPTLHWANPPGGMDGRDTRPTFTETPGPYTGPVPMVPHVHGAVGVGDDSDGYAEAWWLPVANNIPADYATEGTWFDFFKGKAEARYGMQWGQGFAYFVYPNSNRAATIWYHDHTLGMTRASTCMPAQPDSSSSVVVRAGTALYVILALAQQQNFRALPPTIMTSFHPTRPITNSPLPSKTGHSILTVRCSTRIRVCSLTDLVDHISLIPTSHRSGTPSSSAI